MAIKLKQSTAGQEIPLGYFVDSTDGNTEETALTINNTDIKLWKMGATTLANKNSGGATHISNGIYYCVLDATDTNTLGALVVFVHVSGSLAVKVECEVLAANIYDSWIAGTDVLDVSMTQVAGTAVSTSSAQIGVNVVNAAGTAWGSGAITAASLAADAGAEIADAVWDELLSGHTTEGSAGETMDDIAGATAPSAATIADAVWDEALSGHLTAGTTGKALSDAQDGDYLAGSATAATNAKRGYDGIIYGAAVTGTLSTTQATTDLSGYANDALIGRTLTVTSGSRIGQQTTISDYASSGGLLTFAALTGALANGDQFFIA